LKSFNVENEDTEMIGCSGWGAGWREIQEQNAWDDYLAWCHKQENSAHE
jgi:hypothetical protein